MAARKLSCLFVGGADAALFVNPKFPSLAALRIVFALEACFGEVTALAVLTATGLSLAISSCADCDGS